MKVPTNGQASELGLTKSELSGLLYPDIAVDCALPQSWVNAMLEKGFDPVPGVVWGYVKGCALGRPLALTVEAEAGLEAFGIPMANGSMK